MNNYIRNYESYGDYLSGDVWQHNRQYLRTFDSYHVCHVCGGKHDIDLHHSRYDYTAIKLEYPPNFIYPLCRKHHAEVTELAKTLGHKKATEQLCAEHNAPKLPLEHSKHLQTMVEVTAWFKAVGLPYMQVKRSPLFIVQDGSETIAIWATSKIKSFEVKTLLEMPLPIRLCVLEWNTKPALIAPESKEAWQEFVKFLETVEAAKAGDTFAQWEVDAETQELLQKGYRL